MAEFKDDSEFDYLPFSEGVGFIAAGWISTDSEYPRGPVAVDFFRALCSLLENPWSPPVVSAGIHRCEFCRFSGGSSQHQFEDYKFSAIGSSELFVPSKAGIFVAPNSIAHYIDAHGYRPSEAFQNAVIGCPKTKSVEYLKQLLAGGVREWTRKIEAGEVAASERTG